MMYYFAAAIMAAFVFYLDFLADRRPADESSMSKVFNIISVISLIITLGLFISGVMTTLF